MEFLKKGLNKKIEKKEDSEEKKVLKQKVEELLNKPLITRGELLLCLFLRSKIRFEETFGEDAEKI
jgi:hypothetical protein